MESKSNNKRKRPRQASRPERDDDSLLPHAQVAAAPPPRRRKASSTQHQRPAPPPPPPPALISLLQSDPTVLSYFQSLQQNLEADVNVWKDRARSWQVKYEEATKPKARTISSSKKNGTTTRTSRAEISKPSHQTSPSASKRSKSQSKDTSNKDGSKSKNKKNRSASSRTRKLQPVEDKEEISGGEEPIDDNMLLDLMAEQSSSSSSSDDESDDQYDRARTMKRHDDHEEAAGADTIDDAMLQQLLMASSSSSSSSEYDDDNNEEGKYGPKASFEHGVKTNDKLHQHPHDEDVESETMNQRLGDEAIVFLRDELGVSSLQLLDKPPATAIGDDANLEQHPSTDEATTTATNPPSPTFMVRPPMMNSSRVTVPLLDPVQVVSEIVSAMRMLCRLQIVLDDQELSQHYGPFHPVTLLPVIDGGNDEVLPSGVGEGNTMTTIPATKPPHPAIRAKHQLQRSVLILDTFHGTALSTVNPSNRAVECKNPKQQLLQQLGRIVHVWLASLQGEIAEAWACHDRAQQHTNVALVFVDTNDDNPSHGMTEDNDNETSTVVENGELKNQVDSNALFTGGAKSQTRLSNLLERYWLAQLVSGVLIVQGKVHEAYTLVLDYIRSNLQTIHDGPRLAPTLSFVVLRGLLHPVASTTEPSWFEQYLASKGDSKSQSGLRESLSLVLNHTASIWRYRLQSKDDRIVDASRVELASWQDLKRTDGFWLSVRDLEGYDDSSSDKTHLLMMTDQHVQQLLSDAWSDRDDASIRLQSDTLQLTLILGADEKFVTSVLIENLHRQDRIGRFRSLAAAHALRQLVLRQLETLRETVGRTAVQDDQIHSNGSLRDFKFTSDIDSVSILGAILDCSELLADGKAAFDAMVHLLQLKHTDETLQLDPVGTRLLFESVHRSCETPMVRVINLQRRSDRMDGFRAQALREKLFVVLAVSDINLDSDAAPTQNDSFFFGRYAFDGGGRKAEVYEFLTRQLGGASNLQSFVNDQWRPNDLKPFDKDAPNDEGLVRMTDSEIACALSHVASWKGAFRSFQLWSHTVSKSGIFRHPSYLLRLFRLGGFAKGEALLSSSGDMAPSPVCVILEDDAMLVDRFRERLEEVLVELPRDFHFCSLGYGRPKSAPILPYSKHVGVPSHLFYMTGYLLSESGCRYLSDSLPVTGPIDTWIGLKMTQNWDNSFGIALGVGAHSRPTAEALPSRKELGRILQFRAYCALTPLCSQRVGSASGNGTEGRSWRLRDTDIVYSGDFHPHGFRGH